MNPSEETFQTWNSLANLYQEKFMNMDLYNSTYSLFCDAIPQPNPHLLELACGPGNITQFLLRLRPDFKILATDYAPAMVELAAKNNPRAECRVLDAKRMGELQSRFHGILAGFYIPYLNSDECEMFFLDSAKSLVEGGILYFSFVEGDSNLSGFKTGSKGLRVYFNYHPIQQILRALNKTGFVVLHKQEIPYPNPDSSEFHTVIIARFTGYNTA
ncbi:MAG: class I SAM-dependent methyltransferase [Bacteroidetes bacterium]|nr:class I SAM-dependent methyltransferase [Bacteroidota bacterium]